MVERDLDIMTAVVKRLHERFEELRIFELPNLLKVIRNTLLHEMDFRREARYMKTARSNKDGKSDICIPRVYMDRCTPDLLVMEYMKGEGLRGIDVASLPEPHQLARDGLRAVIRQVFEDGFFHADPHPGNLLITSKQRLCMIDWGMVGRMTPDGRFEVIDFINALADRDSQKVAHCLIRMTKAGYDIDRRGLELEIMDILDSHLDGPIEDLHLGGLLLDIIAMIRTHRLHLPMDFVVMIKAIISAEGSCRLLYPELNVIAEAAPHFKRLAEKRYQLDSLFRDLQLKLDRFLAYQRHIAKNILLITDKIEKDSLSIRFEHHNLGAFRNTMENISNRLTFGIIIAALIIGSSMIITTGVRPHLFGFPALGIIGYIISGIVGLWLVFNIIRTRRY
jgi:ubiquinone biosynthesis protein